jgi:hypothetical protein
MCRAANAPSARHIVIPLHRGFVIRAGALHNHCMRQHAHCVALYAYEATPLIKYTSIQVHKSIQVLTTIPVYKYTKKKILNS